MSNRKSPAAAQPYPDTQVIDQLACPNCKGINYARLKRPWYKRIFSNKKHLYCRDCHTHFWRVAED